MSRSRWIYTLALLPALAVTLIVFGLTTSRVANAQKPPPRPHAPAVSVTAALPLPSPPTVSASAYVVYDAHDHRVLASRNAQRRQPIASLSKIMTALVALHNVSNNPDVQISAQAARTVDGSGLDLQAGASYPFHELFTAMLVHSANDAAAAIAQFAGPGTPAFVAQMNAKAQALGLHDTTFVSPTGLDGASDNESTATDLITLARAAMRVPAFRAAVATPSVDFPSTPRLIEHWTNRNTLLGSYPGVDGIKTGFTDDAGNCLLVHLHNHDGDDLYTVVLGEPTEASRDADTRALLHWAQSLRPRVTLIAKGAHVASVPIALSAASATVVAGRKLHLRSLVGTSVTVAVHVPAYIRGKHQAGFKVGTISAEGSGGTTATAPLVLAHDLHNPGPLQRLHYGVAHFGDAWTAGW